MLRKKSRKILRSQHAEIFKLYKQGMSQKKLAIKYGCFPLTIRNILQEHGLKIRWFNAFYEPTLEEIEQRRNTIRDSWSDGTRENRAVTKTEELSIPIVSTSNFRRGTSGTNI